MNLTCDSVLTESPNFVNLGLLYVHTSAEIGSVFIPTTRIGKPTDGSNWLPPGHCIGKITADRVSKIGSEKDYNAKTNFENRIENKDFGCQNNVMSLPPLDSTTLGTNMTNRTTSPIDSIPVRTKTPEPTPLTRPTELSEKMENCTYQGNQIQTHHRQTHH